MTIGTVCAAIGAVVALLLTGGPKAIGFGQASAAAVPPYHIIVDYDSYGIPFRCSRFAGTDDLVVEGDHVHYKFSEHVTVTKVGQTAILGFTAPTMPVDSQPALEHLGLSDGDCDRIQARRFDPDYDQYVGPDDDSGHGQPEDDRTPRSTASDCDSLPCP